MTSPFAELLPAVVDIAERAGQAVLAIYRSDFTTAEKADGTLVTQADRDAESVILAALAELTPGIPVISEECAAAGKLPEITGEDFWLVDPVDGTREFVNRNDEFCVNIGLVSNAAPVLGVLHGPALYVTYAAAGPGSDTRPRRGRPAQASTPRPTPAEGLVAMISRSHRRKSRVEDFLSQFTIAKRRPMGSALKLGLIAAGNADIYPRFGPTSEWDTAAGHAILDAAGGRLVTLDGDPLIYGKPDFLNPGFVAYGRR